MLDRFPSMTAASVALLRGMASLPGAPFDTTGDASLQILAPRPLRWGLSAAALLTARRPGLHSVGRVLSLGLLDHIALRTRAIDSAISAELARGTQQLVILGAGLDARAYRLPGLQETVVFEVDHPATQSLKRLRARGHAPSCRALHYVTVDFERDSLEERLAAAGHDTNRPTVWIWEGVTPYLLPSATASSLAVIAKRSAQGSLALVTYALPSLVNMPTMLIEPVRAAFGLLGEPLRGRMSTEAMRGLAHECGLRVEHDSGSAAWGEAHLRGAPFAVRIEERLMALRA